MILKKVTDSFPKVVKRLGKRVGGMMTVSQAFVGMLMIVVIFNQMGMQVRKLSMFKRMNMCLGLTAVLDPYVKQRAEPHRACQRKAGRQEGTENLINSPHR